MSALTAIDILELQNLVARYCQTTDNSDVQGFMNCWVEPDAFGGYDSGAFGNLRTWQELSDFEAKHVSPSGLAHGKRHQPTNVLIEPISASEAHITHDLVVLEVLEVPRVVATGRYNKSVVVKTASGWRFKRRTFALDPGFLKSMEQGSAELAPQKA